MIKQIFSHILCDKLCKANEITLSEYSDRYDLKASLAVPGYSIDWPKPKVFGGYDNIFKNLICDNFKDLYVIEVDSPVVYGEDGWVYSKGHFLSESTWHGYNYNKINKFPRIKIKNIEKIKGKAFCLASDWSSNNYGHLLLDCITRIDLFEKAGYSFNDVDFIYCPDIKNKKFLKILENFNIPLNKCIYGKKYHCYIFDKIILTSFPGQKRTYPEWAVDFLKNNFNFKDNKGKRRLYISRGINSVRKVINEDCLYTILKNFNFEKYVPHLHDNPRKDFSEASIVVGAHGAGLADLTFCSTGTHVLELLPSDHIYPYYYTLSASAKCNYGLVLGQSVKQRARGTFGPSPYDFSINEDSFMEGLNWCLRKK